MPMARTGIIHVIHGGYKRQIPVQ